MLRSACCSPKTPRRVSLISPRVALASTATRMRGSRLALPRAAVFEGGEGGADGGVVAAGAESRPAWRPGGDRARGPCVRIGVSGSLSTVEFVDADDDACAGRRAPAGRRRRPPRSRAGCSPARWRGRCRPARRSLDVLPRAALELVGQRLDEVGAGQRIDGVGHAGLVGQDLLGAQGDAHRRPRSAGRAPRRLELVCRDCVPPSTAAIAWYAVRTMLLSGCWAVSVEPAVCVWKRSIQERGSWAPKRSRMILRPHAPRGAELGDLFEEVVVAVEEEGELPGERDRRPAQPRCAAWT